MYWMCLVACGHSEIPGVDFSENYSPVVNDVIFQVLHLMVIHFGSSAELADVETAFPYGNYDKKIYMECSQGMKNMWKDYGSVLNKCIYGLVQAVKKLW